MENAIYIDIKMEPAFLKYLMPKGSVTVDGTSLTVFDVTDQGFTISLIPVTQADSIIGQKRVGEHVNIECDMLAKYIGTITYNGQRKYCAGFQWKNLPQADFWDKEA